MSRMNDNSGNLPPKMGGYQPIVIKDGLLGKIGMGLFCASVVAIIMNFGGLKWLVVHIFALFLSLFGKDVYVVKPAEAVKAAAHDAVGKIRGEVKQSVAASVPAAVINTKTPEEREAERIRKELSERNDLRARADLIKFKYQDDWTFEKLRVEVRRAEQEARELKVKAEEDEKKRPLLERADKIQLLVDKTVDYKTLKQEVEEGEKEYAADAKYQAELRQYERNLEWRKQLLLKGPNARCANSKCNYQWRTERKSGTYLCAKCRGIYPIMQARANMPPPPMPLPPKLPTKRKPGLMDRVKGVFGR